MLSQAELARVAALAYEGETITVMLCLLGAEAYTAEDLVTDWETIEISGNGYTRWTSPTISAGSYSNTTYQYRLPQISAQFTASGAGYSYNTVVIYVSGCDYPYAIVTEDPNIALASGQTQTYQITLITDDA